MPNTRIMIVEDEAILVLDIKNHLENYGYSVPVVVYSGEEAVNRIPEFQPDLVLMDIKLDSEIDGIKTVQEIHDNAGIPVVFLTAYASDDMLQRAKVTEPYAYILKPFNERELRSNIEIALYKHRTEKALRDSQKQYRQLFHHIADPVFIIDRQTNHILECNQSALDRYGYDLQEFQKMSIWD